MRRIYSQQSVTRKLRHRAVQLRSLEIAAKIITLVQRGIRPVTNTFRTSWHVPRKSFIEVSDQLRRHLMVRV